MRNEAIKLRNGSVGKDTDSQSLIPRPQRRKGRYPRVTKLRQVSGSLRLPGQTVYPVRTTRLSETSCLKRGAPGMVA